MADREVRQTGKDDEGDITSLCNQAMSWSPRSKSNAISDIESDTHSYYVKGQGGTRIDIHVVNGPTGKYLRTDPDKTSSNNLDDLPNC